MTEVLTDDEAASENQQSNTLPSPLPFSFLFFFSISYHAPRHSSFLIVFLYFLSPMCSRFLICVICCCFSVPYLFPLFPFLFLSSPPGWREALPPQLCQVFPLSHDVPGRRGNVPYRWGERQRCFRLCTANRHKNRLVVSIELAVPCKHPDGLSVSASVEVCVCSVWCVRVTKTEGKLESSRIRSPDKWLLLTKHRYIGYWSHI